MAKWPADKVEKRKVADLIPYARNARKHSDVQVAQIAAAIREWGWTAPILVAEDDTILAGHGRILAAQKLGLDVVPVMVAKGWSDTKKRAYVIADNQIAANSRWDDDMLKVEVESLSSEGFDLSLLAVDLEKILSISAQDEEKKRTMDEAIQYKIMVDCSGEEEQAALLEELEAKGLSCRALML